MVEQNKIAASTGNTDGEEVNEYYDTSVSQQAEKIKVVIKRPGKFSEVIQLENTLKAFQNAVGGHIEVVRLLEDFVGIVDEEGKLKDKPINIILPKGYMCGNIVVCKERNEEFVGLTTSEVVRVRHWLLKHSI